MTLWNLKFQKISWSSSCSFSSLIDMTFEHEIARRLQWSLNLSTNILFLLFSATSFKGERMQRKLIFSCFNFNKIIELATVRWGSEKKINSTCYLCSFYRIINFQAGKIINVRFDSDEWEFFCLFSVVNQSSALTHTSSWSPPLFARLHQRQPLNNEMETKKNSGAWPDGDHCDLLRLFNGSEKKVFKKLQSWDSRESRNVKIEWPRKKKLMISF